MIFTASRGQAFKEDFTFKSPNGKLLAAPNGDYRLTLERGNFVKEYTNLTRGRNSITWNMAADETKALEYETLYFILTYNGSEIARGVLRVQ
jgi:hypothetical protein